MLVSTGVERTLDFWRYVVRDASVCKAWILAMSSILVDVRSTLQVC